MIPLFAPVRQNEPFLQQSVALFEEFYRSGRYILGPEVESFERDLAALLEVEHAIGCASGTEALVLALRALELPPGSQVMTPAFSFVASANAILWAGLRPVFVDVDPLTYCMDPDAVEAYWTPDIQALIAVDLYGQQADMGRLRRFCNAKGMILIEDGAQSIGVSANQAHLYTTSFYPTKNLGAVGDAGAVLTEDPDLADKVRALSRHGGLMRDYYPMAGTTGRLDTLQAAFLKLKLPYVKPWTEQRRKLAARYREQFESLTGLFTPQDTANHVWSLFTLRAPSSRNSLKEHLESRGISAGIYYPKALTEQPALEPYATHPTPVAQRLANEVLSLPFFPELTAEEEQRVVSAVREFFERR